MARPGGNITGVSVDTGPELWGKRLQLLREVVPTISKLAILGLQSQQAAAMQEATEKAGIGVAGPFYLNKGSDDECREVFATIYRSGANGLFVDGSAEVVTKRQLIAELAAKYRLPAIYPYRVFVEAGGLMSYATDLIDILRWAAREIDQILNGANPGDILTHAVIEPVSAQRRERDFRRRRQSRKSRLFAGEDLIQRPAKVRKPLFLRGNCNKGERSSSPEDCLVVEAVSRNRSPLNISLFSGNLTGQFAIFRP